MNTIHSLKQINWSLAWHALSAKERLLLYFFVLLISGSLFALAVQFYYAHTQAAPARGGMHIEGALGIPRFLNPVLAQISDTDRDITRLIYSGLMKYTKDGRLVEDLALNYTIEGNTLYRFTLKDDIFWHDGKPVTSDDVVFTIKLIQDPKYASPIRLNWQGVVVEKVDERTVTFKLVSPYSPFLENTTTGILPKHIWENVSPKSFPLAEANLQPIGSGPYKFEKFQKDSSGNIKSYSVKIHDRYYEDPPFIERIVFRFFDSEDEGIKALLNKEVTAMSFISGYNSNRIEEKTRGVSLYTFSLPRYFAVFFNQSRSKVLAEKEVRRALALATDRGEIINIATDGRATPAFGPIIRELLGYNPQIEEREQFSLERAQETLAKSGWADTDGDSIRDKVLKRGEAATPLEMRLITVQWPELERTAQVLKEQWERIGARVIVNVYSLGEMQQEFIRPREYEALLFGQVVGIDPDPFSFWHSSQKKDPGLNLALYDSKNADKLLEEARQTLDSKSRAEKYVLFQNIVTEDIPAVFLYNPSYLYPISADVKGMAEGKIADPSWRFADIAKWYIHTKRVWK